MITFLGLCRARTAPPASSSLWVVRLTLAAMKDNPVAAFVIGLGIVLLASVLNAGGLNLTKLDHVRCAGVPQCARRSEWLRPLWVLGMVLYM